MVSLEDLDHGVAIAGFAFLCVDGLKRFEVDTVVDQALVKLLPDRLVLSRDLEHLEVIAEVLENRVA